MLSRRGSVLDVLVRVLFRLQAQQLEQDYRHQVQLQHQSHAAQLSRHSAGAQGALAFAVCHCCRAQQALFGILSFKSCSVYFSKLTVTLHSFPVPRRFKFGERAGTRQNGRESQVSINFPPVSLLITRRRRLGLRPG